MPILYGSTEIGVASETLDVAPELLARIRGSEISIAGISQISPTLTGRDRAKLMSPSISEICFGAQQYLRVRHGIVLIVSRTHASCHKLTTIPATRHPVGQLFLNGKSIQNMTLLKGGSYSFGFNLFGRKLVNLDIQFTLRNLTGEIVLSKQIRLDPGGVAIDDYTIDTERNETITGYVVILPEDTNFVKSNNYETKFTLELKNKTTRRYFLEEGLLTFKTL